jgi:vanillate O-demethylase monooxygenase subunit
MNDQSVGTNSTIFLRNAWYVAAISGSVQRDLTPIRVLDTALVFYRTESGDPVALEDACPHRKLPLSMGRLCGDTVECGYHGLTFDRRGQCTAAPTQDRIPPTAVVRSYPVADRYGLLWVWMGNAERADEADILDIENYASPEWHITGGDSLTCHCNYLYLTDNLLDPSHVAWVHRTSFAAEGTEDTPLEVEETADGLVVSRWIYDCEAPPFYKPLLKFEGNADRLQHYEVRFPSIAINKGIYCPAGEGGARWTQKGNSYEMISYNFLTPVDENTTRYFWLQHRNTDLDNDAITQRIASGAKRAFEEDKVVLEAVHKGIDTTSTRPINLALDASANRFRKLLESQISNEQANDE